MTTFNLAYYRAKITEEILTTWRDFQKREATERIPHIERVLPLVAQLNGWSDQTLPLAAWIQRNTPPSPPLNLTSYHNAVTTGILPLWHTEYGKGANQDLAPLTRALPYVTVLNGTCEGKPLTEWLCEGIQSPYPHKRKAIVALLYHLIGTAPSYEALLPALQLALQDPLLRAPAVAALLKMVELIGGDATTLTALTNGLQASQRMEGYVPLSLRTLPAEPDRLVPAIKSVRDNSPAHFTWMVLAAAIGSLMVPVGPEWTRLTFLLRERLDDLCAAMGYIAAETLERLDATPETLAWLQRQLRDSHVETRLRAIRRLERLGGLASVQAEVCQLLLPLLQADLLVLRATALQALGSVGRPTDRAIAEPMVEALKALRDGVGSLLMASMMEEPVRQWLLREAVPTPLTPILLQILREMSDMEDEAPLRSHSERLREEPDSVRYLPVEGYLLWILPDADLRSLEVLEATVRDLPHCQRMRPYRELFSYRRGYALTFTGERPALADDALQCVTEIACRFPRAKYLLEKARLQLTYGEQQEPDGAAKRGWEVNSPAFKVLLEVGQQAEPGAILCTQTFYSRLTPALRQAGQFQDCSHLGRGPSLRLYSYYDRTRRAGRPFHRPIFLPQTVQNRP